MLLEKAWRTWLVNEGIRMHTASQYFMWVEKCADIAVVELTNERAQLIII